jgi:hypothetical protein
MNGTARTSARTSTGNDTDAALIRTRSPTGSYDVSKRWKRLHNAARNATKREVGRCLPLATHAWEPQARGPGHVHPVFALHSPDDVRVVQSYLAHLARLAPKHSFGVVGQRRGVSLQIMEGARAAAYLSSYFVRGKGGKATPQDNARNPHLPHVLIWVSPTLTRATGVNMRNLRRCRQLWAVRLGLLPPPPWSGVELAQIVTLAGPWPAGRDLRGEAAPPEGWPAAARGRGMLSVALGSPTTHAAKAIRSSDGDLRGMRAGDVRDRIVQRLADPAGRRRVLAHQMG